MKPFAALGHCLPAKFSRPSRMIVIMIMVIVIMVMVVIMPMVIIVVTVPAAGHPGE